MLTRLQNELITCSEPDLLNHPAQSHPMSHSPIFNYLFLKSINLRFLQLEVNFSEIPSSNEDEIR
jgi:hypothetical protein